MWAILIMNYSFLNFYKIMQILEIYNLNNLLNIIEIHGFLAKYHFFSILQLNSSFGQSKNLKIFHYLKSLRNFINYFQ